MLFLIPIIALLLPTLFYDNVWTRVFNTLREELEYNDNNDETTTENVKQPQMTFLECVGAGALGLAGMGIASIVWFALLGMICESMGIGVSRA